METLPTNWKVINYNNNDNGNNIDLKSNNSNANNNDNNKSFGNDNSDKNDDWSHVLLTHYSHLWFHFTPIKISVK